MEDYHVIGLMSGTSLDGLDVAYCRFALRSGQWEYEIIKAETIPYPDEWKARLSGLVSAGGADLARAHADLGRYFGTCARDFILKHNLTPSFIASHGHTVFHQPRAGFTFQAGDGAALAAHSDLPVICDFRASDVALGGEGAPLVPAGDRWLFGQYDYCLNLGGFANISYEWEWKRIAFDICPMNNILNDLARRTGHDFDADGSLARKGKTSPFLLEKLERLPYYLQAAPKSLGIEWYHAQFKPLFEQTALLPEDALRTAVEHICRRIAVSMTAGLEGRVLATGGGARNGFFMERLQSMVSCEIVRPDDLLVDFKEALVFAFLGVMRWRSEINILASATGAGRDHCSGCIHLP
ncbi:MAG: anhydro-N-acetylmuramic acid kinase [Bacteroidales bacterium]|nr:anhydro-N-acetylmuramic acid kinase [Bacteroidales bacterium]